MDCLNDKLFTCSDFVEIEAYNKCLVPLTSILEHCTDPIDGLNQVLAYQVYRAAKSLNASTQYRANKHAKSVEQLSVRSREILNEILVKLPTDNALLDFKRRVNDIDTSIGKKCSGRTFDTLVTSAPRFIPCCYYLDITDPSNTVYLQELPKEPFQDRHIIYFDLQASYRQRMSQYSKKYFDCFARGDIVNYHLRDGSVLPISLCQFMFFLWVFEFQIHKFLFLNYQDIVDIRRYYQLHNYHPKKKKRKTITLQQVPVQRVTLCPSRKQRRVHTKYIHIYRKQQKE